jgi:small subunit ribosomal protein S6
MRIYEELFIVRPDATDEEIDPVIEQVRGIVTQSGGTLDKNEKWGVRKLAYRLLKYNEGQYILLQFTAKAEVVREIERRLRVSDLVLKFITVRIDEKLKRIDKRKKAREKRAARKPPAAPSPAAVTSPALPGEGPSPSPGAPTPGAPAPGAPAPAAPAAAARPEPEQS